MSRRYTPGDESSLTASACVGVWIRLQKLPNGAGWSVDTEWQCESRRHLGTCQHEQGRMALRHYNGSMTFDMAQ